METLRLESGDYQTQLTPKYQNRKVYSTPEPIVKAAIPGTIMEVLVKEGQQVKRGDALCILDSMKMNNTICASVNGTVKKVYITPGQSVGKNAPLVEFE
jgi:biotin carboxyl carrier protein